MEKIFLKCAVVIPIYKENPVKFELISFVQCLKILHEYTVFLVAPDGFSLNTYQSYCNNKTQVIYFKKNFFKNIKGYNKLLTSKIFYKSFEMFEYILIYQLDAYVFKNELDTWCKKGYDYIGAPWFKGLHKNLSTNLEAVGNGGFSLRKINSFQNLLNNWEAYFNVRHIIKSNYIKKKTKIILLSYKLFSLFTFRKVKLNLNNLFLENEDYIFSLIFSKELNLLSIPSPSIALTFAFEMNPSFLYEVNNKKLPFGCHGWYKHDIDFWKKFIETDLIKNIADAKATKI